MDPLSGETTLSFLLFLLSSWASTSIGKNLLQDEKILFFKRRIPIERPEDFSTRETNRKSQNLFPFSKLAGIIEVYPCVRTLRD